MEEVLPYIDRPEAAIPLFIAVRWPKPEKEKEKSTFWKVFLGRYIYCRASDARAFPFKAK